MTCVLILSGGLDSTTLLYKLIDEGNEVIALSFDYGQKASKELDFASLTCKKLNVPHHICDISEIVALLNSSNLVNPDNDDVFEPQDTVVPSRNTILLELATALAITTGSDEVYYGAIKGDVGDYPDTTPEFLKQINELNKVNNYEYIPVKAPFIEKEKYEVVLEALKLGVPLDKTWSCYVGGDEPCGECYSCQSRIKAIEKAEKILKEGN
ncbi:MAG: 7-cyano-7-deazaguanine synthase QueC [archaeon]|nr:7-cyano-7-deazaguanine synthase QueC [archaeon]